MNKLIAALLITCIAIPASAQSRLNPSCKVDSQDAKKIMLARQSGMDYAEIVTLAKTTRQRAMIDDAYSVKIGHKNDKWQTASFFGKKYRLACHEAGKR